MWLIVWASVGGLFGFLAFAVVPMAIARIADGPESQSIARKYAWLAMTSIQSSALVARDNSLELVHVGFDPHKNADKYKLDGEVSHVRDDLGVTGRLFNKPFGITSDSIQSYLSPLSAEIGKEATRAEREGELGRTEMTRSVDGEKIKTTVMQAGLTIPKRSQLASIEDATSIITGNASASDGRVAKSWAEKSQELFHEKISFGQAMVFLLSVATGFLMVFLALRFGDVGPGTDRTVSEGALLALFSIGAGAVGGSGSADPDDPENTDRDDKEPYLSRSQKLNIAGWGLTALFGVGIAVSAWVTYGLIYAVVAVAAMIVSALTLPIGIALFGPSIPPMVGVPLSRGLWILAQMSAWNGVIVRLETGEYVYCKLFEADDDLDYDHYVVHNDKEIEVDGDDGDRYLFGWRPLGLTEEKGRKNLEPIEYGESASADGGLILDDQDQGYRGVLPAPSQHEVLIRMKSLYRWVEGSSESKIIERGIREALDQEGGQQQFGAIATIIGCFSGVILGAAIAFVALGGI